MSKSTPGCLKVFAIFFGVLVLMFIGLMLWVLLRYLIMIMNH